MSTTPTEEALRAAKALETENARRLCATPREEFMRPREIASVIDTATGLPALKAERDALAGRVAELEGVLREIVEGEFDDVDPDDGLHTSSVRQLARQALARGEKGES